MFKKKRVFSLVAILWDWLVAQIGADVLEAYLARLFAAVGQHFPLDKHFAVGSLLNVSIKGEDIIVYGDEKPFRGYLYATNMAVWLLGEVLSGQSCHAYNIGSDESTSVSDRTRRVCRVIARLIRLNIIQAAKPREGASHYVPDVSRAQTELGLTHSLRLDEVIASSACWHLTGCLR